MKFDTDAMLEVGINKRFDLLDKLIAEDVEYRTPAAWRPKIGKESVIGALSSALPIIQRMDYHRIWRDHPNYALEFSGEVGERSLQGIDLVTVNEEGKIVKLEAIIRPISALMAIREAHMAADSGNSRND